MVADAEEHKRELASHNQAAESFFKIAGDPRAVTRSSVFSSLHAPVAVPQFSEQNVVAGRQPVSVRRLDAVVDELALRPLLGRTLLKIDTQGHDRQVLEGMSYIDEVALLQVEVAVVRLYEHTPSMAEMLSFAADLRFAPMSLSPINRTVDGGAVEFDYLAVNTRLGARGSEPSPR